MTCILSQIDLFFCLVCFLGGVQGDTGSYYICFVPLLFVDDNFPAIYSVRVGQSATMRLTPINLPPTMNHIKYFFESAAKIPFLTSNCSL